MKRPDDRIRVESEDGAFDRFNAIEVVNDIMAPSQCIFDVGDDGTFEELKDVIAHGKRFRVYMNDQLRLTGRVIAQEVPISATAGATVTVTVRTLLADAYYSSADPKTRVEKTTIKDFLLALYRPLGIAEADFVLKASLERDLMTGVGTRGETAPANLDAIKVDQARVSPPETIFEAAAKHLRRYGLLHWDTPDGKIYVGAPDDAQRPLYRFLCKRGAAAAGNNTLEARRAVDWSDVPSEVRIYGGQGAKDIVGAKLKGAAEWADVKTAGFYRPVYLLNEGAKTQAQVEAQARRERANRSKRKDTWDMPVDGWSYWNGDVAIPYGINTTADVDVDATGGPAGRYYIHRVSCREDASNGRTSMLSMVAPGIFEV